MEIFSDDDFDIISNPGQRSLESSIADLDHIPKQGVHEPLPSQAAVEKFDTVSLTAADIQAYVRKALDSASGRSVAYPTENRTVRVYLDGTFDMFNVAYVISTFSCLKLFANEQDRSSKSCSAMSTSKTCLSLCLLICRCLFRRALSNVSEPQPSEGAAHRTMRSGSTLPLGG